MGREKDWAATPLGPVDEWPQSLVSTVRTMLSSQYPMVLTWGNAFTQIYNDAYSKLIGDRHPAGLGDDIRVTLAEAWSTLGPMIERVMTTGVANWTPALPLEMHRAGYREEAYFSVSHAPAENDVGDVAGMLAVCSEVTQQIIDERRLRLLRELAARAGSASQTNEAAHDVIATLSEGVLDIPYGVLLLREEGTLNLAASFGLPEAALRPFREAGIGSELSVWGLETALSGDAVLVEQVHDHAPVSGGAYRDPVRSAITLPIMDAQGTAIGVLICGVSPNRAPDESYRSFFDLVAGQISIAIRNARAREDEKRRAEELAELDRAKTAFFSNVSHEFRTPLTLILGPLNEALGDAPERLPVHRDELDMARRNALRLLRLVNTLLDFSRVEASRLSAKLELVDLPTITADLASNFRTAIEKAGLQLVVDTPRLSRSVAVDREMYEKIVLNLLSNAFKFTQDGVITVRVAEREEHVELIVSDTGAGIPSDELENVFVRFHQIAGQPARSHEGSGIGLALVKQLVELQGGEIWVTSDGSGCGTQFTVTLPLSAEDAPIAPAPAHKGEVAGPRVSAFVEEALRWIPDSATSTSTTSAQRPHILVADDNADMRAYVRRLLASDYEVMVAADGEEALRAIRKSAPDLVLSDIMMPHLDGFGLLAALRNDPAIATIPVIFLSARAGEEARVQSLEAGADDHLVKPFSGLELRARVAGALDLARLRGEGAARERIVEATRETARTKTALARSERQLKALADALPVLICRVSRDLRYLFVNRAYEDWVGRPVEQIVGKKIETVIGSEAFALVRPRLEAALEGKEVQFEIFMPYADIRQRHVSVSYVPERGPGGEIEGLYGLVQDITERKLAERHRELLVDELNHRVKNTLAVVQSIAAQSFRGERHPAEARSAFEGRLLALSDAHNLLTRQSWDHVMLNEVIASAIRPFGEDRFDILGPDLALTPKAAVSMALAFHELSTNAAKYGALSISTGVVRATWSLDAEAGAFHLRWEESGGPRVETPDRTGFGSRLIQRGLAAELGGTVDMIFAPDGLSCTIVAPLANIGGHDVTLG